MIHYKNLLPDRYTAVKVLNVLGVFSSIVGTILACLVLVDKFKHPKMVGLIMVVFTFGFCLASLIVFRDVIEDKQVIMGYGWAYILCWCGTVLAPISGIFSMNI